MALGDSLRGLLFAGRQLKRLADAAERIADRMDGKLPPPTLLKDAPPDPVVVLTDHASIADAYVVETRLRDVLGRDPTPEEIVEELDEASDARDAKLTEPV